jgi:uncharacterized membrane protein
MDQPSRRLSPRWPSFGVLFLTAAYLTARWDSIPARWVIHWGARGEPNGWATRSVPGVYGLLVLPLVVLLVNEAIAAVSRPALPSEPATLTMLAMRAASRDMARIGMFGITVMCALLAIDLPLGPRLPLPALVALGLAPVVVALAVGGARLTATLRQLREGGHGAKTEGYHALYYANGSDRRLWVPKTNGMGWTINFSHPLGWPMLVLVLAVPIVAIVIAARSN